MGAALCLELSTSISTSFALALPEKKRSHLASRHKICFLFSVTYSQQILLPHLLNNLLLEGNLIWVVLCNLGVLVGPVSGRKKEALG